MLTRVRPSIMLVVIKMLTKVALLSCKCVHMDSQYQERHFHSYCNCPTPVFCSNCTLTKHVCQLLIIIVVLFCRVIKRLISILSQFASVSANYDAVLRQANNANAELTRRMESEPHEVRCMDMRVI